MRRIRASFVKTLADAIKAPERALSLAGLARAVDAAQGARQAAVRKQARKGTVPGKLAAARNRKAREKARMAEKARERKAGGPGFRGTARTRTGLLPVWAEWLADCPDGLVFCPQSRSVTGIVRETGWLEATTLWESPPEEQPRIAPLVHMRKPVRAYYRLSEEGRLARDWMLWVRARRVLGWPCPMFGVRGAYVRHWLRGEDLPLPRMIGRVSPEARLDQVGYAPGDAADAPWPGLWAAILALESGEGEG